MAEDGYLIDSSTDELQKIMKSIEEKKSRSDEYAISIILNMKCNFRCVYCFEHKTGKEITYARIQNVVRLFEKISTTAKKVEIDWFGGEPLLSFSLLKKINDYFIEIAKKKDLKYSHSITTNGYLLNEDKIEYLSKTPVSSIVVTIDGPEDVHDLCRPLRNGSPTYSIISSNVKKAVDAGLHVVVRVNLTKLNNTRVIETIQTLEKLGLKNRVELSIQAVVSSKENPCENICLKGKGKTNAILDAYIYAAKNGWKSFPTTEQLRVLSLCIGEYPGRMIIGLDGSIYRCSQADKQSLVGKVLSSGKTVFDPLSNNNWINSNPLSDKKCRICAFLPLCMGGCKVRRMASKDDYCLDWTKNIKKFLQLLVINENLMAVK
ncbi:MAG: radical SAM protein [Nanoarchaeota archaeon]